MVPVRCWSTSYFPDPWNCPYNGVCCMKPSGCPTLRFCSRGSETEDFGTRRQETGILYSRTATQREDKHLIKYSAVAKPRNLPEIKEVQSCHRFQNSKLVDQQSEDHHDPLDARVDFEHVALISDLGSVQNTVKYQQIDLCLWKRRESSRHRVPGTSCLFSSRNNKGNLYIKKKKINSESKNS